MSSPQYKAEVLLNASSAGELDCITLSVDHQENPGFAVDEMMMRYQLQSEHKAYIGSAATVSFSANRGLTDERMKEEHIYAVPVDSKYFTTPADDTLRWYPYATVSSYKRTKACRSNLGIFGKSEYFEHHVRTAGNLQRIK